jgi:voltage-gated sodium channel
MQKVVAEGEKSIGSGSFPCVRHQFTTDLEWVASQSASQNAMQMEVYLEERMESAYRVKEAWPPLRRAMAHVVHHQCFEIILLLFISCNMVTTVIETDLRAAGHDKDKILSHYVNRAFLMIYILEISARVYVLRFKFLESRLNIADFIIVLVDLFSELLSNVIGNVPATSMLRIIRVVRFLRAGHIIVFFPELYWMTRGMFCALKALFWGILLIIVVLTIWSIIAVEVLHPLMDDVARTGVWDNCPRCINAFDSVTDSLLTFFGQIVAGDSWCQVSVPLIRAYPWRAVPILCGALFSINLGVLNLILTVIVDRAQQAHAEDLSNTTKAKVEEYHMYQKKLHKIVQDMDVDGDGIVTVDELRKGYKERPEFRMTLQAMDIGLDDMGILFHIMDEDKSGSIDYEEFASQLHKMKTSDSHTLLVFIQHYVKEVRDKVGEGLEILQDVMVKKAERDTKLILEHLQPQFLTETNQSAGTWSCEPPQTASNSRILSQATLTESPGVEQLWQAISELTAVIRDASHKSSIVGFGVPEPKYTDSHMMHMYPASSFTRGPGTPVANCTLQQEKEAKSLMHRCCHTRTSPCGLPANCSK